MRLLAVFILAVAAASSVSADASAKPEADPNPAPKAEADPEPKLGAVAEGLAVVAAQPEDNSAGNSVQKTAQQENDDVRKLVSDVHCMNTPNLESFSAYLRRPDGLTSAPVLESDPAADASDVCLVTATATDGVFALDLGRLDACGVRTCKGDGDDQDDWLCVLIRFPVMTGLKLPEDDVIEIKCKPQDRSVEGTNTINFQKNTVEQLSPTIYVGGGQDFLSEIGLFRRLPGTALFASRVKSGSSIELGENVQLRSIVRGGDGWNFARITDVSVHRVHDGVALTGDQDVARLVTADGCRNHMYRVLAPNNPWRDAENGLINNFDFRVFMFQSMMSGDAIMITAKVVACVEEIDCAPTQCGQDLDYGYGRRRRSVDSALNSSNLMDLATGKTHRWEENLELKIRLPDDLMPLSHAHLTEGECKLYLLITLAVALTFCVLSAVIVLVACIRRCNASNSSTHQPSVEKSAWPSTPLPSPGDLTWLSPPTPSQRPSTVRSVKRRDKLKSASRAATGLPVLPMPPALPPKPDLLNTQLEERIIMV